MPTIYTDRGIKHNGRGVLPSVEYIKEESTECTPKVGWVHHMEARMCGATFRFALTREERNKPASWVQEQLGPEAAGFDEKDSPILLDAIDAWSKPDWKPKVIPPDGFYSE